LYAYGANNPVHYIDPDGNDIKESELYSLSVGAGVAGCFSLGIAKDSNHKTAIFVKLESGFGVGGSLGKFDKALKSLDTVTTIVEDLSNDYDALKTIDNVVIDKGNGNFEGNITHKKETAADWKEQGKTLPVEAAVLVGVKADENGTAELTLGATAIANVYLRKDTWYFDITKLTDTIKELIKQIHPDSTEH